MATDRSPRMGRGRIESYRELQAVRERRNHSRRERVYVDELFCTLASQEGVITFYLKESAHEGRLWEENIIHHLGRSRRWISNLDAMQLKQLEDLL